MVICVCVCVRAMGGEEGILCAICFCAFLGRFVCMCVGVVVVVLCCDTGCCGVVVLCRCGVVML